MSERSFKHVLVSVIQAPIHWWVRLSHCHYATIPVCFTHIYVVRLCNFCTHKFKLIRFYLCFLLSCCCWTVVVLRLLPSHPSLYYNHDTLLLLYIVVSCILVMCVESLDPETPTGSGDREPQTGKLTCTLLIVLVQYVSVHHRSINEILAVCINLLPILMGEWPTSTDMVYVAETSGEEPSFAQAMSHRCCSAGASSQQLVSVTPATLVSVDCSPQLLYCAFGSIIV